jgi:hypothetical protein
MVLKPEKSNKKEIVRVFARGKKLRDEHHGKDKERKTGRLLRRDQHLAVKSSKITIRLIYSI